MCTVNDEDEVDLMIEKEVCTVAASNCRKCQERETEVVLRGKDPYCRTCFIAYATHKFRASLGKSKMVRKGDKILIGFSGSDNCMALIHLIQAGFDEEVHKRLVFEPYIIYIDDGAAFNVSVEERSNVIKNVTSTLKKCNIKCYIANLESIFNNDDSNIYCDINSELAVTSDSKLSILFSNMKCATSKEDLLIKLRNNLLLKIAFQLNCCKIITGENLVNTASKLLSNVSLGRGAQLPFDIGFCDSRDKNIKVLRPLQDFSREEIEFYNSVYKLECIKTYSSKSNENSENSIQALTRQFIEELQENFPSTVSTVYRTGAKLTVENEAANAMETCSLCLGPIDTNVIESSSLQATVYSSIISNSGPEAVTHNGNSSEDIVISEDSSCSKKGGKCKCSCTADERVTVTINEAVSNTCYGCRLILKNLNSVEDLPQQVLKKIQESNSLRQMKNEIQDFLL